MSSNNHVACSTLAFGLLAIACSGGDEDQSEALVVRNSAFAVGATTPLVADGYQFAFLASEAASGAPGASTTDLNGDRDTLDDVAVLVDARTRIETVTGIAARAVAMLGGELYLSVDEARDDFDWSGDDDKLDHALLRFGGLSRDAELVAELADAEMPLVVAQGRLWFAAEEGANGVARSGLHFVAESSPAAPIAVLPQAPLADSAIEEARLLGARAGCVFVLIDEAAATVDLNGDGDSTDANVLALVDAREVAPVLRSTRKALASDSSPFDARADASGLLEVAFLVGEDAQGSTNLNTAVAVGSGSIWTESQCTSSQDADALDEVLHYIRWPQWVAGIEPEPRNTGLPGSEVIVLFDGFVAVDCDEADHGGCDLNDDDDSTDTIARWTQVVAATVAIDPHSRVDDMHPIADLPGGTHGLSAYDGRLFIAYSESDDSSAAGGTDLDGNAFDDDVLLAVLDAGSAQFNFTPTSGGAPVGATWMRPSPTGDRMCVAITERVVRRSLNGDRDADLLDSIPTFAYFISATALRFDGPGIAVEADDAGISSARVNGFYKVDEDADAFDWNGDGDKLDLVVRQSQLSIGSSRYMGTSSSVAGAEAADYGGSPNGPSVAMFLSDEAMLGQDLNGDGDASDRVVRWFRFD